MELQSLYYAIAAILVAIGIAAGASELALAGGHGAADHEEAEDRRRQRSCRARSDDDFLGRQLQPLLARVIVADRQAQLGQGEREVTLGLHEDDVVEREPGDRRHGLQPGDERTKRHPQQVHPGHQRTLGRAEQRAGAKCLRVLA